MIIVSLQGIPARALHVHTLLCGHHQASFPEDSSLFPTRIWVLGGEEEKNVLIL